MRDLAVVGGALRYEFWMQLRRRSVWVVLGLLSAMIVLLWNTFIGDDLHGHYSKRTPEHPIIVWMPANPHDAVLWWAQLLAMFLPLGIGLVLADRLARDTRIHVDEMLDTLPSSLGARLMGKFLGSLLATLVPVALIYAAVIAFIAQQTGQMDTLSLGAATFAAILLPASIFVAGFSVAVPVVLRVPVYQFLFAGYWFWANLMSPKVGIPSIAGTMLNAAGPWAQEGIFQFSWTFLSLHATVAQGYMSIALLIGLGLVIVYGAWGYLHWQHARR